VIETARKALDADPGNVALVIKLSQAQASVWRSKEAAETCTKALETYPDDIDLLTERGHRYVRQFPRRRRILDELPPSVRRFSGWLAAGSCESR
jgi:hypothetical protein